MWRCKSHFILLFAFHPAMKKIYKTLSIEPSTSASTSKDAGHDGHNHRKKRSVEAQVIHRRFRRAITIITTNVSQVRLEFCWSIGVRRLKVYMYFCSNCSASPSITSSTCSESTKVLVPHHRSSKAYVQPWSSRSWVELAWRRNPLVRTQLQLRVIGIIFTSVREFTLRNIVFKMLLLTIFISHCTVCHDVVFWTNSVSRLFKRCILIHFVCRIRLRNIVRGPDQLLLFTRRHSDTLYESRQIWPGYAPLHRHVYRHVGYGFGFASYTWGKGLNERVVFSKCVRKGHMKSYALWNLYYLKFWFWFYEINIC